MMKKKVRPKAVENHPLAGGNSSHNNEQHSRYLRAVTPLLIATTDNMDSAGMPHRRRDSIISSNNNPLMPRNGNFLKVSIILVLYQLLTIPTVHEWD